MLAAARRSHLAGSRHSLRNCAGIREMAMRAHLTAVLLLATLLAACSEPGPSANPTPTTITDPFAAQRVQMVTTQIEGRGVHDLAVLAAMRRVPRHRFVPAEYVGQAYADHPLPIGFGQTISQPYIVGLMSEAIGQPRGARVLEIGTGSGYQAAVLAEMGMQVYTVEILPELAGQAQRRLNELVYHVEVLAGDGYYGWPEHAPYDAIIVTAAPDHLPQPLVAQLASGGRLIIPIGPQGSYQTLWLFEKKDGELTATNLGEVSFVPFTGAASGQK